MIIREAVSADLAELLELYLDLHEESLPEITAVEGVWQQILADGNQHVLVGTIAEKIIASCVVSVIPNLTRQQRPYALIENVVTKKAFRSQGYGSQLLTAAKNLAQEQRCYKIMLMTGAKEEATLRFYQKAGYNLEDKTAFIQWLAI
ncbi:N-acetyltransferase family protein [Enterococcus sp. LJL120]